MVNEKDHIFMKQTDCSLYHRWQFGIAVTIVLFILSASVAALVKQSSIDNSQDTRIVRLETQNVTTEKILDKIDKKLDVLISEKHQ